MQDVFICPSGSMLENWKKAFPKALVIASLEEIPTKKPVLVWVHANADDEAWLDGVMAGLVDRMKSGKAKAIKMVVLANTPNQADALAVMAHGAVGYCHAYSAASMLKELKTVVMHGGIWLGQDLLKTLISASKKVVHNSSDNVAKALALLTTREKQAALEAAEGLSNKEIARKLDITERTVKAHISSALEKLDVKDRLQLALVLNEKMDESKQRTLH